MIMRIREPKSTALIFGSGKIVVLGAKSEDQARVAARKYAKIIRLCDHPSVKFKEFKVCVRDEDLCHGQAGPHTSHFPC